MYALPKVPFFSATINCFKDYINFSGRIRRSEYWFFFLFNNIVIYIIIIFLNLFMNGVIAYDYVRDHFNEPGANSMIILLNLYFFGIILPTISSTVRRLHDVGKKGEYIFIGLVPLYGGITLLVLLCKDSMNTANEFGQSPKYTPFINNLPSPNPVEVNEYPSPDLPYNNMNTPSDNICVPINDVASGSNNSINYNNNSSTPGQMNAFDSKTYY